MQCLIIGNDEKGVKLSLEAADYLWNSGCKIYLRSYSDPIHSVEEEKELLKNTDVILIFEVDKPAENRPDNYLAILSTLKEAHGLGPFLRDREHHDQGDADWPLHPKHKKIFLFGRSGVLVNFSIGNRKICHQPVVDWDSFQNFIDRFRIIGQLC